MPDKLDEVAEDIAAKLTYLIRRLEAAEAVCQLAQLEVACPAPEDPTCKCHQAPFDDEGRQACPADGETWPCLTNQLRAALTTWQEARDA